jgi:hypothetical protein
VLLEGAGRDSFFCEQQAIGSLILRLNSSPAGAMDSPEKIARLIDFLATSFEL